jgi:hypothetical protein
MDFNDISDKAPVQEFNVPQDRNVAEYAVKYAALILPLPGRGADSDTPGRQSLATFPP